MGLLNEIISKWTRLVGICTNVVSTLTYDISVIRLILTVYVLIGCGRQRGPYYILKYTKVTECWNNVL